MAADESTQEFYSFLAPYYDLFFPRDPQILDFLRSSGARPGARVGDIACGSGLYAKALLSEGVDAWGLDAAPELLELARRRSGKPERFILGDMRRLDVLDLHAGPEPWDMLYCVGNSIVHLPGLDEVEGFIDAALGRLSGAASERAVLPGILVLQWVALSELGVGQTRPLPSLEAEDLTMHRFHTRLDDEYVRFDARVERRGTTLGEISNRLLLLRDSEVRRMLLERDIDFEIFGGFRGEPVTEESWVRVLRTNPAS